jgi:hypothetical protein
MEKGMLNNKQLYSSQRDLLRANYPQRVTFERELSTLAFLFENIL